MTRGKATLVSILKRKNLRKRTARRKLQKMIATQIKNKIDGVKNA